MAKMPMKKAMSGMKRMATTATAKKAMSGPGKQPKSTKAGLQKIMAASKSARKASK